jgi:hypothetical protein
MERLHAARGGQALRPVSEPVAGVVGGLAAGAAYLLSQVAFSAAAETGGAAAPLQRIAAILMGPDTAPPPAELSATVVGMALIIHFGLAMVFGRLVCAFAWRRRDGVGIAVGAIAGLALYAVNFGVIAPGAFPWFADSLRWSTIANHALFGAVAAAVCLALGGPRAVRTQAQR